MKKSVGSFISSNRNLIFILTIVLGLTVSGVVAWQVSAVNDSSEVSQNNPPGQDEKVNSPGGTVSDPSGKPIVGQDTARGIYRGVTTAARFDVSPPLRLMQGAPAELVQDRGKFEDRNTGFGNEGGPQDIDRTVQTEAGPSVIPTPITSFDSTIGCGGCAPPDPVGDVGPNHYVAMGNLQFQIFNKTGTSLFGPVNSNTLWAGFGGDCQTDNSGDPIVIYDQLDDRWILTQFTSSGPTYFNCVAVSTSPDPTGTYFRYAFSTGSNFPDYPKYGMWHDALYISTREFAGGSSFAGIGAYAVNRAQLIAGNPAAQVIGFLATTGSAGGAFNIGDGLLPTDIDGSQLPPAGAPNYFLGSMDNGASTGAQQDALTLWKFTANFAVPANSTFVLANTIPVNSVDTIPAFCSGRSCVPQPSTTARVDHLGYRQRPLHRAAYRNFGTHESIVTNQSVEASATMSGIRWYELRSPNSSPVLFQDATYAPGLTDGIHRWMGSIAQDSAGNMALGYSGSSGTVFPSVMYTGRLASDPINTMPQGEGTIKAGTGSQTGGGSRWGDYTSMNVDPVDDCTFWYVNEYIPTTSASGWRLRIGSFKFAQCGTPDFTLSATPASREVCAPANAVYTVNVGSVSGYNNPVTLAATGNPAGTSVSFSPNPVVPGNASTMTVSGTGGAAAGTYTININGTAMGSPGHTAPVDLTIRSGNPAAPTLNSPANGATGQSTSPTFTWAASAQATTYTIEIATDMAFTNIVHSANGLTGTSYSGAALNSVTTYFWRVRGVNACGTGANSAVSSFTTALICNESFDSVTAPALPAGWTTAQSGSGVPWVTSTTTPDTPPNAAFAPDPGTVGNMELISPPISIAAGGGSFSFRNNYNTETGFDGMVLEISINGGAYQDILAAGGSFAAGGYNGTISTSFMSPIGGRMAWTGNSGGYITSTVNLPAAANGQSIRLKWRMATDSSVTGVGVRVDTITGIPCGGGGTPTPTATGTATATPTGTPTGTLVTFSSPIYTEDESQTAVIGLVRSGITTGTSVVTFATSNGTAIGGAACTSGVDYISVNQMVTFNPGETMKTVNVVLCGDGLDENNLETVNLTLTGPDTGGGQSAVLRINDTANAFRNVAAICTETGAAANPYPSTITVTNGPLQIGSMRVTLYDYSHLFPDNTDVLLVGPGGEEFVLMGDAGGPLPIDPLTPVTLTFQDNQPLVLPDSGPLTTNTYEPTTWESPVTNFPAPAPPGPYNEPGSTVGGSGAQTLQGTFGSTNANGVWSLYVRDDAGFLLAVSGCFDGGWGLEFLTPTAASASITGRVMTAEGLGIRNAEMVLTGNTLTEPLRVTTSSFGYYSFEDLEIGETYVLTVNSRRYTFQVPSRVITLTDNAVDIDFTAEPLNATP